MKLNTALLILSSRVSPLSVDMVSGLFRTEKEKCNKALETYIKRDIRAYKFEVAQKFRTNNHVF